jgi:hypothetical protein
MLVKPASSHHAKGLLAALQAVKSLGIDPADCLAGTGLNGEQLLLEDASVTMEQEFTIYRNILRLTDDPLVGLQLGAVYLLVTYGILGYAMLSAQTLGEALTIAAEYSDLTYSHFRINQIIEGSFREWLSNRNMMFLKTCCNFIVTATWLLQWSLFRQSVWAAKSSYSRCV